MEAQKWLIRQDIEPWMAKLIVRMIKSSLDENKWVGTQSDIDKPLGADVFKASWIKEI